MSVQTPQRIVQILASRGTGGLERHFVQLCNGLAEHGHDVYAIAHAEFQSLLEPSVHFTPLDLTKSRRNPFVIWRLYRVIKDISPDIVHAQANKAAQMLLPILPKIKAHSVVTIHNIKKSLSFLNRFEVCVGVSKGVVARFPESVNARVIYNGSSISQLNGNKLVSTNLTQGKPVLTAVGRLVEAKGFDILIDAVKNLDCRVRIVGDGPLRGELKKQIESLALSDKVVLLGHREDVPDLITESDLVVISSRKEGFSYVFSESMLLRRPVISTDVPVPNEILPEAFIAKVDAQDLAEKIQSYFDNQAQSDTALESVFHYAQEELSFEGQLIKTIALYDELLSEKDN